MKLPRHHLSPVSKKILEFFLIQDKPITIRELRTELDLTNYFSTWRSVNALFKYGLLTKTRADGTQAHEYILTPLGVKECLVNF